MLGKFINSPIPSIMNIDIAVVSPPPQCSLKPGSNFLQMWSKILHHMAVFAANVSQKLNTVRLLRIICGRFVTLIFVVAFAFTWSVNPALGSHKAIYRKPISKMRICSHLNVHISFLGIEDIVWQMTHVLPRWSCGIELQLVASKLPVKVAFSDKALKPKMHV